MLGLMIMASMILLPRGIIPSLLARMRGGKS